MRKLRAWCETPIGPLRITGTAEGIEEVVFVRRSARGSPAVPPELRPAVRQLEEYFRGGRREFTVGLALSGTGFQKTVWSELVKIPYGSTATYGGIAAALGRPGAARAVGGANHRNPVSIIVPCHRVVGAGSDLTGYGGGLWRKRWLLDHERSGAMKGRRPAPAGTADRRDGE